MGLPVNYAGFEFELAKEQLDWSQIPAQRLQTVHDVLGVPRENAMQYVEEAEAIVVEEMSESTSEGFRGVGDPMGRTDRLTLYAAIRSSRPSVVVETGTAAGASAVYILTALERNQRGRLISVDASGERENVGRLIPDELRNRLQLLSGDSLVLLPSVTESGTTVDFFVHDSLHTYTHMMAEYEWAYSNAGSRCVLCSHDILMTNAWPHFLRRHGIAKAGSVKNLGVCVIEKT